MKCSSELSVLGVGGAGPALAAQLETPRAVRELRAGGWGWGATGEGPSGQRGLRACCRWECLGPEDQHVNVGQTSERLGENL